MIGKRLPALLAALAVAITCGLAWADVHVRSYTRKDGTRVQSHYRSNPDGNFYNNWSTKGNVNPYTGRVGTRVSPPTNYGRDVPVTGYTRSDGTYVQPHMRSAPDGNFSNNWSTKGNTNPYTGKPGTLVNPPSPSRSSTYAGRYAGLPSTSFSASSEATAREESRYEIELAAAIERSKSEARASAGVLSNQRRRALAAEVEADRANAAAQFDAWEAENEAGFAKIELAAVESDKADLRSQYRVMIASFDREQALADQQFWTYVTQLRAELARDCEDRVASAARLERGRTRPNGEPSVSSLLRDEQRSRQSALEINIENRTAAHKRSAASGREAAISRATSLVRRELDRRVLNRRQMQDSLMVAARATHESKLNDRIAKLRSDFETAEVSRLASDQAEAERRLVASLPPDPAIASLLELEPAATNQMPNNTQPTKAHPFYVSPAAYDSTQSAYSPSTARTSSTDGESGLGLVLIVALCICLGVWAYYKAPQKGND